MAEVSKPRAYIEKVVVEGFKSYGRKRKEIPLGEGFIAIVGPNGSGKSNIGDAISFALGLASSKVLRAKNLSYLVWSRGNQRADYAEVEVHFRNEGAFPLSDERIVFSRRVYSGGRSVFKINGKTVKERDVKELLTRAGITENAYNVVLQGDIIHFLKMTPVQRRKLIEEIAGIGEFDEKKQKALEELGEVEIKLKELKLVLEELEKQLKVLERDREVLRRYRELSERKRELELKLRAKEFYRLKGKGEKLKGQLFEKERAVELLEEKRADIESSVKAVEGELGRIEELLEPYREKIGKLESEEEFTKREIEKLERELEELKEKRAKLKGEIEKIETLLEGEREKLKGLDGKLRTLEETKRPLLEKLEVLDSEISKLEGSLREAVKGLEESELELKKVEKLKGEREKRLNQLLKELSVLDAKVESTEEKLKTLEEEKRELLSGFVGNISYEEEKFRKIVAEKEESLKALRERLSNLERKISKISEEREKVLRELLKLEAEASNISDGAVEYLKRRVEGVYGTVAELIKVSDEEYLTAVEIAGGGRLKYVVVEDENVAKECIRILKEENLGRLTFIPLNKVRVQRPSYLPRTRGVIDYVFRLLDFDPYFEKAILYTFGDTVLVEDFETAKRLGIGVYRMVTLEGELFEKGGTITGGKVRSSNLLREGFLKAKLQELEEKTAELERKLEKLKKEREKLKEKLWSEEGTLNYAKRKLKELEELKGGGVKKLKDIEERIEKGREYLNYLKKTIAKKEEELEKLQEEITNLEELWEELQTKRRTYTETLSKSGLEGLKEEREKLLRELRNLEKNAERLEREKLLLQKEIENRLKELERKREELKKVEDRIGETSQNLESLRLKLEEIREAFKEAGEVISKLVEEREKLKERLERLKGEQNLTVAKLEKERRELDRLQLELSRVEEDMKKLFEEPPEEPEEEIGVLKRELSEVERELSNLGGINFKAEEEYRAVKERYGEFREKYQTLLREKRALTDFIAEIEKNKERIFLQTFKAINRNFKEIFAFLSPGGKAKMELEKPEDIFAGGINMVVKPRGKEVKYLEAMSGGEKTLAALALIFAVQRYKPVPFYYFDEVDAHLDEANAVKVGELIKEYSKEAQFIVVTLRESVAYLADKLIGVTSKGGISEVYILDPARLEG